MTPALTVALLWLLFGGTHVGLATARVRGALVARLGEGGFRTLFTLAATITLTLLVTGYAQRRGAGVPGPALGALPLLQPLLLTLSVAGIVLAAAGDYPRAPMALFPVPIEPPRGVERITRHPMFAGAALFGTAHALLAAHLTGTVFFGGLAALSLIGAHHQDRKLLARRGGAYAEYLAVTSTVPFVAVLAGRQQLHWRELRPVPLLVGLGAALALRSAHDLLFAQSGVWIVVGVFALGTFASWQSQRFARRHASRRAPAAAQRPTRA